MAKHALAGAGKFILSIAAGFSISFALAVRFFEYNERAPIDRFFLFAIPALAVGVCAYSILPRLRKRLEPAAARARITLAILVLLSAISAAWLGSGRITVIFFAEFAALSFVFGAIAIPAAPFVQRAFDEKTHARIFFDWVGSTLIVFFIIGFLDDFYGSFLEVAALTTLLQFAFGIAGQFFVKRISRPLRERLADSVFMMLPFFLTFAFAGMIFQANRQSPLFPAENFTLTTGPLAPGAHWLEVAATDSAGNVTAPYASAGVMVGSQDDSGLKTVLYPPENTLIAQSISAAISGAAFNTPGKAIAGVDFRINGGQWQPAVAQDGNFDSDFEPFFISFSSAQAGTYFIEAFATDIDGNQETSVASQEVIVAGGQTDRKS
ncbi:MAG: hypothetical protein C4557_00245, partial [Anaerolineaceae bacterium]